MGGAVRAARLLHNCVDLRGVVRAIGVTSPDARGRILNELIRANFIRKRKITHVGQRRLPSLVPLVSRFNTQLLSHHDELVQMG